jgi:hypothetical protein
MSLLAFTTVTELTGTSPGHFVADVSPAWTIEGKPNGGYLVAMLGRAAALIGPHEDLLTVSAYYLHSPDPGPVDIEVEVLRAGRSVTHVRARMLQQGRSCVEALLITGRLDAATPPYWDGGLPAPQIASWDECVRVPPRSPNGLEVDIMSQVELRLDPAVLGFASGRPTGRGDLRGWLALPHEEIFDPAALVFAVDALPPATFDIEMTGWVPTLELSVYVRALAAPGPVQIRQIAGLIDGQRVDETCWVWDQTGRLVAQGTQLAGIRLGQGTRER